jgi:hypothetical protein
LLEIETVPDIQSAQWAGEMTGGWDGVREMFESPMIYPLPPGLLQDEPECLSPNLLIVICI